MTAGRRVGPLAVARLLTQAVAIWWSDNLLRLGASIAYYMLFAIAPILVVAVAVAGAAFGEQAARGEVIGQIEGLVGRDGAAAVQALIEGARRPGGTWMAVAIGVVTTMLAAGGVFLELQSALNIIWRVAPRQRGVVHQFLRDRAQAFGVVLAVGFLLLVSLALSAALSGAGLWLQSRVAFAPVLLRGLDWLVTVAGTAVLFALLFKVLPDVALGFPDVAAGGLLTALLFAVGKHLIGLYLTGSGAASSYGAMGSVGVLLLWVYYSSQIVLIGAQFTKEYTEYRRVVSPA